ncbi:hypothetical protein [Dyella sp. ASV21]|uniref:hypothetical protein n=1 Tax=Dyella sp. ASV21 TaxID=2795114 RepID=UPI0018EC0950|nr:hypothetical protein [Dyella sp. ASV21]
MVVGNGTDIHKVLPVYRDDHSGLSVNGPAQIGQLVCTPAPDFGHPIKIMDVIRSNQIEHNAVSGTIRNLDPNIDYREKPKRLPVLSLGLGKNAELMAIHSKMRRCIVLARAEGIPLAHLPQNERALAHDAFDRTYYLVAPIYSVSTPGERRAMTPTIAARAECLVYPHLVYLPKSGGVIANDSIARLDRSFWSPLAEPTELYLAALSEERMNHLSNQLNVLHGLDVDEEYLEMVALLRGELAQEFEAGLPGQT